MNGIVDRRAARVGGSTRPLGTNPSAERWRVTGKPRREGGLTHWYGVENATHQIVRGVVVANGPQPGDAERAEGAAQRLWGVDHRSVPKPVAVGKNPAGELVVVYAADRSPSLVSLLTEGAMNPARVVALGVQLFDALAAAHGAGLAHGALTADQLRVAGQSASELLVVEGLGIRALAHTHTTTLAADISADLYAAGQILHQMLLGELAADFRRTVTYGLPAVGQPAPEPCAPKADPLQDFPYAGPLVDLIRACLDARASARPESARYCRDLLGQIADPWEAARPRRARPDDLAVGDYAVGASAPGPGPVSRRLTRVRPVTAPFEPPPAVLATEGLVVGALAESNERLWATVVAAVLAVIAILLVALPDRPAQAETRGAALSDLPTLDQPTMDGH